MMMFEGRRSLAILLLCLLGALGLNRPACGQVLINEILADPASDWDGDGALDTRSDEWVEVVNAGTTAVDLSAYWLRDEASAGPRMQLAGTLAAGATAVFYGSDATAWQEATGISGSALSLNNGGDTVVLMRTVPGSEPLAVEAVDTVTYPAHAVVDDRSCGWDTNQDVWVLYDGLNPYTGSLEPGGTGCPPTPGETNLCNGQVPNHTVSFGALKVRYR